MQLTVTALSTGKVFSLDIPEDLELENFKALCEAESNIPAADIVIIYNGVPLTDVKKPIKNYGIKDHDMIVLGSSPVNKPNPAQFSGSAPILDFSKIKIPTHLSQDGGTAARMLAADPMDLEAQKLIAQDIENKNIDQNLELAMEYSPENFGTVVMLYIDCKVNGHSIKAFVDSGAQTTIMSQKAAERCNIMRLVDKRWAGIAKGVGTQKIIGRVHMAQIQVEKDFLTSSFSILEEQPMDMLLGLDMLKRHQCTIDLKDNVLIIGSTGTKTRFLPEAELPACARLGTIGNDVGQEGLDEAMKASATEHYDNLLKEAIKKSEEY